MAEQTWRLLDLETADGPWNMALDEALLDAVSTPGARVTLRFYDWTSPCLSIGCGQAIADVDCQACESAGLPIVRRASGGTAVLHEAAFGLSLAIPASSALAVADIVESYRLLGEPVHAALVGLGIDGTLVPPDRAHRGGRPTGLGSSACFGSLAPYEVVFGGRKIVGTSQVRRRGAILHHVMLTLRFDAVRFASFLAVESDAERAELAAWLDSRIGSLTAAAGRLASAPEVVKAIIAAFERAFGAGIEPGSVTDAERQDAAKLVESKYGNAAWTERR